MYSTNHTLNVQIAFQGGGAKIYALIAAAVALRELENENKIRVTRVSGSSAGAIVAALYASKVSSDQMRRYFATLPTKILSQKMPSKWGIALKILLGKPIINEFILREKLNEIVEFRNQKIGQFSSPKLIITCSDLKKNTQIVRSGDDDVINSLLDSCRIPFIFGNKDILLSDFYDGGITGNLPIDHLMTERNLYGPIIGFTFQKPLEKDIKNPFELLIQIINSALDSSVSKELKSTGAYSIELDGSGVKHIADFVQMARILDPNNSDTELIFKENYEITKNKLKRFHVYDSDKGYVTNRVTNLEEIIPGITTHANKGKWVINYKYTNISLVHRMQDEIEKYLLNNLSVNKFPIDEAYFDAIQRPELAMANDAYYTFPFFLSHIRHNFWGVIKYGNHRALGIVIDRGTKLKGDSGFNIKEILEPHKFNQNEQKENHTNDYWVDDVLRAIHASEGKLISLSGYLINEIIPLMLVMSGNSKAQYLYPKISKIVYPIFESKNETNKKDFKDLKQKYFNQNQASFANEDRMLLIMGLLNSFKESGPRESSIIFDLADYDIVHFMIEKLELPYDILKINHYLNIPVGIGFSLPTFGNIKEQHWESLKKISDKYLDPAKEDLMSIGIELNKEFD